MTETSPVTFLVGLGETAERQQNTVGTVLDHSEVSADCHQVGHRFQFLV